MSRANNIATRVARRLQTKIRTHEWQVNWKPLGVEDESADVAGKARGRRLILIEIELRRGAPVANVAKIWKWKVMGQLKGSFVLFQVFSKFYASHRKHREDAEFIGKKMEQENSKIRYVPLSMRYSPRKMGREGGRYMLLAGDRLAQRVWQNWRKIDKNR